MKMKRSVASRVFDTFNILFMIFLAFITIYPFWNVFIISISPPQVAEAYGLHMWVTNPSLLGYDQIQKKPIPEPLLRHVSRLGFQRPQAR